MPGREALSSFLIWIYVHAALSSYLSYLNDLDVNKKTQFIMQIGNLVGLEFLDLKLTIGSNDKTETDVLC